MLYHVRAALARVRELFRRRSRFAAEQHEEFSLPYRDGNGGEHPPRHERRRRAARRRCSASAARSASARRRATRAASSRSTISRVTRALPSAALTRAPAFAAGVIATLGIGIGAAVGIGTIVYGVLLRDLPYDKPDQLVRVGFHTDGLGTPGDLHSAADLLSLREERAFLHRSRRVLPPATRSPSPTATRPSA